MHMKLLVRQLHRLRLCFFNEIASEYFVSKSCMVSMYLYISGMASGKGAYDVHRSILLKAASGHLIISLVV